MLEVFVSPEHIEAIEDLRTLAKVLFTSLYCHHEDSDEYKVSYLGITDSLETVLPDLLIHYNLIGIHLSCESETMYLPNQTAQPAKVFCLVFTEKTTSFVQYHLSYICSSSLTLHDIAEEITELIQRITNFQLKWVEKSGIAASCKVSSETQ